MTSTEKLSSIIDEEIAKRRKKISYDNSRSNLKRVIDNVERRIGFYDDIVVSNYDSIRTETLTENTKHLWSTQKRMNDRQSGYLVSHQKDAYNHTSEFFKKKCIESLK